MAAVSSLEKITFVSYTILKIRIYRVGFACNPAIQLVGLHSGIDYPTEN